MARRRTTRSYGRRTTSRSYSGSRRVSSPRRRATSRRSTARRSSATTVRLVIEQPGMSAIARPELIGKMPVTGLTRTRSRF